LTGCQGTDSAQTLTSQIGRLSPDHQLGDRPIAGEPDWRIILPKLNRLSPKLPQIAVTGPRASDYDEWRTVRDWGRGIPTTIPNRT